MFNTKTPARTKLKAVTLTAALLALAPCTAVLAETPEERGLAIAIEADKRDLGYVDSLSLIHI